MSFNLCESNVKNVSVVHDSTKSKMEFDSQENYVVTEIVPETSSNHSVTTILGYCKRKMLNPYLRILSFMGLRPLVNIQENSPILELINCLYIVILIFFMVLGYILQYMSCFRRDRGFWYNIPHSNLYGTKNNDEKAIQENICYGSTIFSFILPSSLHFVAYIHAIYTLRCSDDDQLPVLMERVILASSNLSNGFVVQKKLMKTLWIFIVISMIWMLMSCISIASMITEGNIDFRWIPSERSNILDTTLKVLLVVSILWHDMVEAIIISNYCLQSQLLMSYVFFLRERLLQHAIEPIKWMREIEEFKKMLQYLNSEVAKSVSLFTLINISYALSGLLWLFKLDFVDKETLPIFGISVLIILLWFSIAIIPLVQAIRLTNACERLKEVGQAVRVRPFVHSGTPGSELDSVLLYTSSLKIHAILYGNRITGSLFCFCFVIACIIVMVLGMCHYLSF
ncbi:hypothetical protein WA026_000980 [Henosepilachna vigintioctopunctata]|uniref:Gustatory receptor n=1 Tax=Henosepilachna vigintioctopunctata TaxID=420089 RepID=A0AAW1V9R2_9CUCU